MARLHIVCPLCGKSSPRDKLLDAPDPVLSVGTCRGKGRGKGFDWRWRPARKVPALLHWLRDKTVEALARIDAELAELEND